MKTVLIVIASILFLTSCATPTQVSLDAEVKRLCAIDGGVRVYERVNLPPEKFDKHGSVQIRSKEKAKPSDEYYYERDIHYYKDGQYEEPAMWRTQYRIIRRSDGKILGESVRYSRRGGDVPGPWHPSSFSCPPISKDQSGLESSVFLQGGTK